MLFRYQFEDRSLKSIESKVLNFHRAEEEIAGYLAPVIYQDFLKTGETQYMDGIFYHNKMDVVSLAALISIVNEVSDGNEHHFSRYDTLHFSLARQFDKNRNYSKAIDYYLKALEQPKLPNSIRVISLLSLANLYKKSDLIDKAMDLWRAAADLDSVEAFIEMAKILEHRHKSYFLAFDCCKKALLILDNEVNSNKRMLLKEMIEYRMERLKNKGKI
jgi:tetratricopeptide (TPR) repeat protein